MAHLIVKDYVTEKLLWSGLCPRRVPVYRDLDHAARQAFGGVVGAVYDHLATVPRTVCAKYVTIYVSPRADGVGRDAVCGKPFVWAVVPVQNP